MVVSKKNLPRVPTLDGVMLEDVALSSASTNIIKHGLGRAFVGCHLALNSSNANVWFDQTNNRNKAAEIHVQCSANTTVNLWIF